MAVSAVEIAVLFPAYAGVIPGDRLKPTIRTPFPRIRGGDPSCAVGIG